ncbi:hypothetical protein BB561_002574 [Smittium simulii]|uniref:BHLH domain-containing protein n=1 Tax=Smittium simulii TaxID=133385 RepID=A0A2T9YQ39_9FUNG|nr:hypothetical protein BB561_002574 [Smittium simulii]
MSSSDAEFQKSTLISSALSLEKKLKRKTSHSEIEKRRRKKINYALKQLQTLVPWLDNDCQYQKLEILEHAVDFISLLKSKNTSSDSMPKTLMNMNQYSKNHLAIVPSVSPVNSSSEIICRNDQNSNQAHPMIGKKFVFHKNNTFVHKKLTPRISKKPIHNKNQSENQMSIKYLMS